MQYADINIQPGQIHLTGGFWGRLETLVREQVLPYQWEALNDRVEGAERSGAIQNFRRAAGLEEGGHSGMVFQDSDVAKWLEGCALSLASHPDKALEEICDGVIDIVAQSQQPDGYLGTYYTLGGLDKRWTNLRDNHELYCIGHMMEAAVAYWQATGKRKLLDVMERCADHVASVLGREEGKKPGYPGHQEVELALVKLYQATGQQKYLDLASYFIDQRGTQPHYYDTEPHDDALAPWYFGHAYSQSHKPVREQESATGHAVRQLYMLSAMADLALLKRDDSLFSACRRLWEDITCRQMYVTGGVGSEHESESFSVGYDLPNDTVYAETCASVALVMFARRMLRMELKSTYADIMERALYNGILGAMSLDGRRFFYVNPLEVDPVACEGNQGLKHVLPARPAWFGCACCPPNLARLVSDLGRYMVGVQDDGLSIYLYGDLETKLKTPVGEVSLRMTSGLPYEGWVKFSVAAETEAALRLRLPDWAGAWTLHKNGQPVGADVLEGFLTVRDTFSAQDEWKLLFTMPVRRVYAHPRVKADVGKVCLQRGPLVYCAEEADNGKGLSRLALRRGASIEVERVNDKLGGIVQLKAEALYWPDAGEALYRYDDAADFEPGLHTLTLIPYYTWSNRTVGEMTVWLHEVK